MATSSGLRAAVFAAIAVATGTAGVARGQPGATEPAPAEATPAPAPVDAASAPAPVDAASAPVPTEPPRETAPVVPSEPVEDPPSTTFELCRATRRELFARLVAAGPSERRTILAAMPACTPTMTSFVAPVIAALAPMRERVRFTLTVGPLLPIAGILLGGFAGDARFEASVRPHVAVAVTGIGMYVHAVLTEDVYVGGVIAIADVRLYSERFSGGYVGLGPVYAYVTNSGGTGFLGGRVEADDGTVVGGTAIFGWKWISVSGFTQSLQLGIVVAHGNDTTVGPQLSYQIGGSFGG